MKNHTKIYWLIHLQKLVYKNLIGAKQLQIRFDRVTRFIRVYDGIRYLVLFGPKNILFTIGLDIL